MTRCITTFAILSLLLASGSARAQMFFDDFEDGDATDGIPVSWGAPSYADAGTREVIDGSFVLTADPAGPPFMDTDVEGRVYRDVSIRTQFMASAENAVGLYVRSTLSGPLGTLTEGQQLWSLLWGDGRLTLAMSEGADFEILEETFLGWDPTGREVQMQLDLFDDLLTVSAWPDELDRPQSPQLSHDVSSVGNLVEEGRIGIWTFRDGTGAVGPVAFRYVQAVPEPSTLFLIAIGTLSIAVISRRTRLSRL